MVIAFEGLDGSGKDTQIKLFTNYLESINKPYVVINSCSSWLLSKIIRDKLKDPNVNKKQLAGLFIAELHEHVDTIKIALNSGKLVILNRWIYSTMAYNSTSVKDIEAICELSVSDIKVDHIIYLNVDINTAMNRINSRDNVKEVYETPSHLTEVSGYYEYMKKMFKFEVVDGCKEPQLVANDIRKFLEF